MSVLSYSFILFWLLFLDICTFLFALPSRLYTTSVCILAAETRFQDVDLYAVTIQSLAELRNFTRSQPTPNYWQSALWVNKAYALKFGYKFVISNQSEYSDWLLQYPRSPTWTKLTFVLDFLESPANKGCEWIAMLDSDAFFWMNSHTTSLDAFFANISIAEDSFNYPEFTEQKAQYENGQYPWRQQKSFFVFGKDGDFGPPIVGYPSQYGAKGGDYLCAGVFFAKNDKRARHFLRRWVYCENCSKAEEKIHEHGLRDLKHEQMTLNEIHYPLYRDGIYVYPHRHLHWPYGEYIHHVWGHWRMVRGRHNKDLSKFFYALEELDLYRNP